MCSFRCHSSGYHQKFMSHAFFQVSVIRMSSNVYVACVPSDVSHPYVIKRLCRMCSFRCLSSGCQQTFMSHVFFQVSVIRMSSNVDVACVLLGVSHPDVIKRLCRMCSFRCLSSGCHQTFMSHVFFQVSVIQMSSNVYVACVPSGVCHPDVIKRLCRMCSFRCLSSGCGYYICRNWETCNYSTCGCN